MQTRNTLLDDLARVASGVLGVAAGARREAEELLRQRFAAVLARGDFVTGDEFDAVKAMAAKARADLDTVADRLAALESAASPKARKSTARSESGPKRGRAKRAGKAAAKPRAGRGPAAG
jgi:BMFP domain-containing protein YqiC